MKEKFTKLPIPYSTIHRSAFSAFLKDSSGSPSNIKSCFAGVGFVLLEKLWTDNVNLACEPLTDQPPRWSFYGNHRHLLTHSSTTKQPKWPDTGPILGIKWTYNPNILCAHGPPV